MPTAGPTAAYLYILSLDGPGRAWEYLRRNETYVADWESRAIGPSVIRDGERDAAETWGLRCPGGSRSRRARGGAGLAA